MAYSTTLAPGLIASKNGSNGRNIWSYVSADALTAVTASGYITNGAALGMKVGDPIYVYDTTNSVGTPCYVSAVGATTATISSVPANQELTASGAVTPGVKVVELNHASVAIAATIADLANHTGFFMVINTSASGTAAHTLTLSAGTFNGTNTVATLNAPAEALAIWVEDDGTGRVICNTNSVGLS